MSIYEKLGVHGVVDAGGGGGTSNLNFLQSAPRFNFPQRVKNLQFGFQRKEASKSCLQGDLIYTGSSSWTSTNFIGNCGGSRDLFFLFFLFSHE